MRAGHCTAWGWQRTRRTSNALSIGSVGRRFSEWARGWLEPATCCQRFWCTCASRCRTALSKELYRFRRQTWYISLHARVHRVRVHLLHLGLLQQVVAMLQARASASSQGHDGRARAVTRIRCPALPGCRAKTVGEPCSPEREVDVPGRGNQTERELCSPVCASSWKRPKRLALLLLTWVSCWPVVQSGGAGEEDLFRSRGQCGAGAAESHRGGCPGEVQCGREWKPGRTWPGRKCSTG